MKNKTVTYKEYFNVDLIRKVQNCTNIPGKNEKNIDYTELMENYLKTNGNIVYTQNSGFGRFYSSIGLQFFQKDIRKYLSNGFYTDIDIVNCHPVILEQLFEMNSIETPEFLVEYNGNRNLTIDKYGLNDKLTATVENKNSN
jgi:hypothetical protein